MKKLFVLLLSAILLITSTSFSIYAQPTPAEVSDSVNICIAIDMVQGTGSGVTQDYLDTVPQRYQGAILLLRLLGQENQALNYIYTTNFLDNTEFSWLEGRHILGFLYENRNIGFEGYADGTFRPFIEMTAKQYYKVMLVALGYVEYVDFEWNETATLPGTLELAQTVGLTKLQDDNDFRISDLCVATVEALRAYRKGTMTTLAQYLVDMGHVDAGIASGLGLIASIPDPTPDPVITPTASLSTVFPYETAIAIGDTSIEVKITNGTFIPSLGEDNAYTSAFADGISGSLNTATSLNSQFNIDYEHITRTSDTTVLLTFPIMPHYIIDTDETIEVIIPASSFNENVVAPVNAGTTLIEDMGSGTLTKPIAIIRPEDFTYIKYNPSLYYKQQVDLDFTGITPSNISEFNGSYNGADHTISNYQKTARNDDGTGVFNTANTASITNVIFENATINGAGYDNVGVLIGISQNTRVSRVEVNHSTILDAQNAGMVIGENVGPLTMSYVYGSKNTITSSELFANGGGIIGISNLSGTDLLTLSNIYISQLEIETTGSAGGIVSKIWGSANIADSNVFGLTLDAHQYIGGIAGFAMNNGSYIAFTHCNTTGTLKGTLNVGGIVGGSHTITLTNNYSGISSYTSRNADMDKTHRILGQLFTGSATLDNTANEDAIVQASDNITDYSGHFVSDASGLDGLDVAPPMLFPLVMKPALVYIVGYVDPWVASLTLTIDDLIDPTHD